MTEPCNARDGGAPAAYPAEVQPTVPQGWDVEGPKFKSDEHYLSKDGDNPEAPWPGYGWPLGSECWYYILTGHGWRLFATGPTVESACRRAEAIAAERTRDA